MNDPSDGSGAEFTLRALFTGIVLGALLTPCNVYSGLKIGWSFNMSITAALLSFAFWRGLEPVTGHAPPGILENNINQTTASSAASIISGGLVAPIPALTLLTGKSLPWDELVVWVFSVSILGVVLAMGLRGRLLSDRKLRFPSGLATAETLRDIYGRSAETLVRVRLLGMSALGAAALRAFQDFIIPLPRLSLPFALTGGTVLRTAGIPQISLRNLGFSLDPSLLMVGFGAIIGLRTGLSLLLGAGLAWGILAPLALAHGWAQPGDPQSPWFATLVKWLVWPGVTLMVSGSLTAFLFQVAGHSHWRSDRSREDVRDGPPRRYFVAGLAVTGIAAVVAQSMLFDIRPLVAVVAVVFSLGLAVVAARVVGETGIPPIGALGKVTQLTFGAISPGHVADNLMSANVTGGAAGQCADLLNDLKTGKIIGASPSRQALAQCFGVLTGSLAGASAYLMLVPHPRAMLITPEWPAPAVATWKAVAEVLRNGLSSLPLNVVVAMVVAALAGVIIGAGERVLPARWSHWLPSAPALGLAFVIPAWNSISLFLGAMLAFLLARYSRFWTEHRLLAAAAGLVAGESLAGVVGAAISFLGA